MNKKEQKKYRKNKYRKSLIIHAFTFGTDMKQVPLRAELHFRQKKKSCMVLNTANRVVK